MSALPDTIRVLERGWLSSNNIVLLEGDAATVIDSGYVSDAEETLALIGRSLDGRRLSRLINTHSHSDHIGGNATLRRAFGCRLVIPAAMEDAVVSWDESALLLSQSDQHAERFDHDDVIHAGQVIEIGGFEWTAIPAPGHDMTALMFHCPARRILISGDALWRKGFGVVFPALLGDPQGLPVTRATLESIARLPVDWVIPGHGAPFEEVGDALREAFARLDAFERDRERLARHAARVMLSFALLHRGRMSISGLAGYLDRVSFFRDINQAWLGLTPEALGDWLVGELVRAGAARREGDLLIAPNAA